MMDRILHKISIGGQYRNGWWLRSPNEISEIFSGFLGRVNTIGMVTGYEACRSVIGCVPNLTV